MTDHPMFPGFPEEDDMDALAAEAISKGRRPQQAAPWMLLNREAQAWLSTCAVVSAAAAAGVVPWRLTLLLGAPLVVPAVRRRLAGMAPRTLSDRQLAHAWWSTSLAARSGMPVESRMALADRRRDLLDEMLRRRRGRSFLDP